MAELQGDGAWVEYLSEQDCWMLLSLHPVGRLAVLVDDAPEIYPVNHVVDGQTIVFRTDEGNKLRGIVHDPRVCFEADGLNIEHSTGWSVLVKGRATEITDRDDLARVAKLPLWFWGIGGKVHWIRIVPTEITGRAIRRQEAETAPIAVTPSGLITPRQS
jgi:uncharacterized protein